MEVCGREGRRSEESDDWILLNMTSVISARAFRGTIHTLIQQLLTTETKIAVIYKTDRTSRRKHTSIPKHLYDCPVCLYNIKPEQQDITHQTYPSSCIINFFRRQSGSSCIPCEL